MTLTPQQTAQLRILNGFRATPPTIRRYVTMAWKNTLLLTLLCLGAAAFFYWGGWPAASGVFVGMLIGTLARDLGWYRKLVRNWPLSEASTNWSRVEELIQRNS